MFCPTTTTIKLTDVTFSFLIAETMINFKALMIVLLSSLCFSTAFDFNDLARKANDAAKVAGKATKSLVEKTPQIFSPEQLLDFGKQSIAGVPLEALAATINKICKYLLSIPNNRSTTNR